MTMPSLDRVLDAVLRIDFNFDIKYISDHGRSWMLTSLTSLLPTNVLDALHSYNFGVLSLFLACFRSHGARQP